jgi:hypothetical protein
MILHLFGFVARQVLAPLAHFVLAVMTSPLTWSVAAGVAIGLGAVLLMQRRPSPAYRAFARRFTVGSVAVFLVTVAVFTVPGAVATATGSLLIGAWLWCRAATGREARGGHLWWPGRIEDRWNR